MRAASPLPMAEPPRSRTAASWQAAASAGATGLLVLLTASPAHAQSDRELLVRHRPILRFDRSERSLSVAVGAMTSRYVAGRLGWSTAAPPEEGTTVGGFSTGCSTRTTRRTAASPGPVGTPGTGSSCSCAWMPPADPTAPPWPSTAGQRAAPGVRCRGGETLLCSSLLMPLTRRTRGRGTWDGPSPTLSLIHI